MHYLHWPHLPTEEEKKLGATAGAGGDDLWTHLWQYARVFLALLLADFLLLTVRDTCSCTQWAVSLSYVPPFCSCPAYLPYSCLLASSRTTFLRGTLSTLPS